MYIDILKQDDETFQTTSMLTFTPSKADNEMEITCQALNDVMEEASEDTAELNILCKTRIRRAK